MTQVEEAASVRVKKKPREGTRGFLGSLGRNLDGGGKPRRWGNLLLVTAKLLNLGEAQAFDVRLGEALDPEELRLRLNSRKRHSGLLVFFISSRLFFRSRLFFQGLAWTVADRPLRVRICRRGRAQR